MRTEEKKEREEQELNRDLDEYMGKKAEHKAQQRKTLRDLINQWRWSDCERKMSEESKKKEEA